MLLHIGRGLLDAFIHAAGQKEQGQQLIDGGGHRRLGAGIVVPHQLQHRLPAGGEGRPAGHHRPPPLPDIGKGKLPAQMHPQEIPVLPRRFVAVPVPAVDQERVAPA